MERRGTSRGDESAQKAPWRPSPPAKRWAPVAYILAMLVMAYGLWAALFNVPADYQQGDSFRILYIHVPAAWMSMFVFGLMALYAAIALVWRIKMCEILAMACAPEAWVVLRRRLGLSIDQARDELRFITRAVFSDGGARH